MQFRACLLFFGMMITLRMAASDGRIPIAGAPYTINAPGHYYVTQDLSVGGGSVIQINASHVVLDLNGHTLMSFTTNSGYIIQNTGGAADIRITNGAVQGGLAGIALSATAASPTGPAFQVDHVRFLYQGDIGLWITSSGGVYASVVIEDDMIIATAKISTGAAVNLAGARGRMTRNLIKSPAGPGINCQFCVGLDIAENTLNGCTGYGIHLDASSNYNRVERNLVSETTPNSGVPITVDGNANDIEANAFQDYHDAGLWITGSTNVYHDNRANIAPFGNPYYITGVGNVNAGGNY